MIRLATLSILSLCLLVTPVAAQPVSTLVLWGQQITAPRTQQEQPQRNNRAAFRAAVIAALPQAVQAGNITRAEAIRIRVAMISPAFADHAYDLAITQMAASGSENVPRTETGFVDEVAINWDGLTEFLKVFIPLLLELLRGLGIGA